MKKIDIGTWDRRAQYEMFTGMAHPRYFVSFPLDVTRLYGYTKEEGLSFYFALIHSVTRSLNSVENFRYKIRGTEVYLVDRLHPGFTTLKQGAELFQVTTCRAAADMKEFCAKAKTKSEQQTSYMGENDIPADELIHISCLPWMEITAISNENDHDPNNSIPTVSWGKYVEKDGKLTLNMTIEVNHRLVDGIHIGKFYQELQRYIDNL